MHIIGIIIALATAVFWVGRAARSAKDIADMASTLKNMKRPSQFKSRSAKREISEIDDPMDAAVILMICVARLSNFGQIGQDQISDPARTKITELLTQYMQISKSEAQILLKQMLWTTKSVSKPQDVLGTVTSIISKQVDHQDAKDLSTMLRAVSLANGDQSEEQENFISRFEGRIGITS